MHLPAMRIIIALSVAAALVLAAQDCPQCDNFEGRREFAVARLPGSLDGATLGKRGPLMTARGQAPLKPSAAPPTSRQLQRWLLAQRQVPWRPLQQKQPLLMPPRAYDREFALNGATQYRTAREEGENAIQAGRGTDGGRTWIQGSLVLITGANSGIGKETARVLGTVCGARVLLACRTVEAAKETAEELRREPYAASDTFTPVLHPLDLSSQECVRNAADFILQNHLKDEPLDRLICNAGLAGVPGRAVTQDGHEIHFGVNHLGHFTLVNKLLDSVKQSLEGRIIIVSSETHRMSSLNLTDLMVSDAPDVAAPFMAYGRSKLANLLFAKELSRRLAAFRRHRDGWEWPGQVSVFALCPGLIDSGLSRYSRATPEGKEQVDKMYEKAAENGLLKSIEEGAASSVYLASVSNDRLAPSGSYYTNCIPLNASDIANDEALAGKLWQLSEQMTQSA